MSEDNANTRPLAVCLQLPIGETVGENVLCSICFSPIDEVESITLNCSHSFCESCITDWHDICLREQKFPNCPLCRMVFYFIILNMTEWIRDDEHYTINCSYCIQEITYQNKPAYYTPDICDHQFCYRCIMNAASNSPAPALFKCPVCDKRFEYIRLFYTLDPDEE